MKHLFVGGCADGKWIETSGQRYIRVPKHVKLASISGPFEPLLEVETYEAERWRSVNGDEVVIFKPSGSENTLEKLVHGYHPGEAMTIVLSDRSAYHDLSVKDYQRFQKYLYDGGVNLQTLILSHSDPPQP